MTSNDLAKIVLGMKGKMPESSRHLLGMQILKGIGLHLQAKDATLLKGWQDSGSPAHFMASCEFTSGPPWVNYDLAVHDTDLAAFCNRWMNVERIRRSKGGEWETLTAEQNDIRCKMVAELKEMANLDDGSNTNNKIHSPE